MALCDEARRQGAKINGIGFQAHISLPRLMTYEQYYNVFKKVADRGYMVHISELDITINGPEGKVETPSQALFNQQYQYYKTIARAYKDAVPKHLQFGITVWGATDKYNWLRNPSNYTKYQIDWPCIYDANLQRKPGYYGFVDGLR